MSVTVNGKQVEILISEAEITARVNKLAELISIEYKNTRILIIID